MQVPVAVVVPLSLRSASPLKNPYNNSSRFRGTMLEDEENERGKASRAPLRQRGPFFMNIRTRANKFEWARRKGRQTLKW